MTSAMTILFGQPAEPLLAPTFRHSFGNESRAGSLELGTQQFPPAPAKPGLPPLRSLPEDLPQLPLLCLLPLIYLRQPTALVPFPLQQKQPFIHFVGLSSDKQTAESSLAAIQLYRRSNEFKPASCQRRADSVSAPLLPPDRLRYYRLVGFGITWSASV